MKIAASLALLYYLLTATTPCRGQDRQDRQDIQGTWAGTLEVSKTVKLRLAFRVTRSDAGYTATMDSIDQGVRGIAVTTVQLKGDALFVELRTIGARYEGKLAADGRQLKGTWFQSGQRFPLDLERVAQLPEIKRPQEPKAPFPYQALEVAFSWDPRAGVGASLEPRATKEDKGRVTLSGTLTMPKGPGPFPAAILVTGSGPQDRDESLLGHRPFLVIADALTRRGIAVLRYDDRGVAQSTGDHAIATTADFANDACAALAFLKTRQDIDPRRIGIIGHSEGGLIAPLAATQARDVAYVVLLAGPGVNGAEIVKLQVKLIGLASGQSAADVERTGRLQQEILEVVATETNDENLQQRLGAILRRAIANATPAERQAIPDPEAQVAQQVRALTSPWFRFFVRHEPGPILEGLRCPVLALFGERDLQVDPNQNLPSMVAALERGKHPDYTIMKLAGLNHLFQSCKTGAPTEYAAIEETFAPRALQLIGDWVLARFLIPELKPVGPRLY